MWKQWVVLSILKVAWMLTHANLTKLEFPDKVLTCLPLFSNSVLRHNFDLNLADFVYDFLDAKAQEPVK